MARYLLEIYTPNRVDALERTRSLARSLSRSRGVRYVRTILVPEDETCFHLVEATSAEAVRAAAGEASVPVERIAEAVEISRRNLKEES